ncbi:hypothetical protein JCM16303_003436 [Sporobolomyces ruberrimus]
MASTTSTSTTESITNTISDAANYVKESVVGASAESKKEANKEVAKGNTNASLGDRVSAGFSAVGNKADESKANAKADGYKESAKN